MIINIRKMLNNKIKKRKNMEKFKLTYTRINNNRKTAKYHHPLKIHPATLTWNRGIRKDHVHINQIPQKKTKKSLMTKKDKLKWKVKEKEGF
jgi:hypothetical protein